MYLYAAKFYLDQQKLSMGAEYNYKWRKISYIICYFLYMNFKFHYKYAGLFFVQTDHHSLSAPGTLSKPIGC